MSMGSYLHWDRCVSNKLSMMEVLQIGQFFVLTITGFVVGLENNVGDLLTRGLMSDLM